MKCPYCKIEMEKGKLFGGRYHLKWFSEDKKLIKVIFNLGGVKIKNIPKEEKSGRPYTICYKCVQCKKLVMDF
jgi:hypothetical protein